MKKEEEAKAIKNRDKVIYYQVRFGGEMKCNGGNSGAYRN